MVPSCLALICGTLNTADAVPPMWNVRMVSCVPGSPMDCAAMMPVASLKIPVVVGTTGWLTERDRVEKAISSSGSGMVWSPNFSIGVNVFFRLVQEAARLMADEPSIRRVGLGDPSRHKEGRAIGHDAEIGG